jgi:hypothetical protein
MPMLETDPLWPFYQITAEVQRAYHITFSDATPGGKTVLYDLARFCHAYAPAEDQREIGRRDVWLHIQKRMLLRDEELMAHLGHLTPEKRMALFDRKSPMYSPR